MWYPHVSCFWFDSGFPYLTHECITVRQYVAYIHDPLRSNLQGFWHGFVSGPLLFIWFDIGLPYLGHASVTMRECIVCILDPDRILTFDLKVKFIGFMTWLCVQASAFLSFDIVILCLAHQCIIIVWCVAYIHYLCMTLTFDLNIKIKFSPWI